MSQISKCIFAKCTRLARPLSFASLFPDTGEKYKPSSEGLICIYVSGIFDLVKWVAEMIDYIASNDG